MKFMQVLSIVLIAILVANIVLFAFGKISMLLFWTIIAVGFIIVKFLLPRLKH